MKSRVSLSLSNDMFDKLLYLSDVMQMSKSEVVEYLIASYDAPRTKATRKYSRAKTGRKARLNVDDVVFINNELESGESVTNIAQGLGVSRRTIYNYLNNFDRTIESR